MEIELNEIQQSVREGVGRIVDQFGDEYWSKLDQSGDFPHEFHAALANGGYLGITMPEELGGSGLGVTEAAIMMNRICQGSGGYSAASTIHLNLFGPHAVVVFGTPEQKERMLKPLIAGTDKACFGVTEPDAGLDTTSIRTVAKRVDGGWRVSGRKMWTSTAQVANKILLLARTSPKPAKGEGKPTDGMTLFYTDMDRSKIEVRRIAKHGRAAVDSNAVFIDDLFIPEQDLIGDEGRGFYYLLDGLNPERILIAVEAIGIGLDALRRAARYARERVVFGRPIGRNQGIQHPLAECWVNLEAALLLAERAADLYDAGQPCGPEANGAKLLGSRAGYEACQRAVLTHGGMGYAKEFHVERLLREVLITRIAPVTDQLILSFIAEKVLDLPKSY